MDVNAKRAVANEDRREDIIDTESAISHILHH